MHRVSSNFTLFLKIFAPTLWFSFFTLGTITIFLSSQDTVPLFHNPYFRWPWVAIYLSFIVLLYFTVIQLRRVEIGPKHLLISNYLKTLTCYVSDANRFKISDWLLFKTATIYFDHHTSMGKSSTFLISKARYKEFCSEFPEHPFSNNFDKRVH